mgnify:CR=1 FL=1
MLLSRSLMLKLSIPMNEESIYFKKPEVMPGYHVFIRNLKAW